MNDWRASLSKTFHDGSRNGSTYVVCTSGCSSCKFLRSPHFTVKGMTIFQVQGQKKHAGCISERAGEESRKSADADSHVLVLDVTISSGGSINAIGHSVMEPCVWLREPEWKTKETYHKGGWSWRRWCDDP